VQLRSMTLQYFCIPPLVYSNVISLMLNHNIMQMYYPRIWIW
jgi:hypothetical protein